MNKEQIIVELEKLGVEHKKSARKHVLAALLEKAQKPDRVRDASRQKGV